MTAGGHNRHCRRYLPRPCARRGPGDGGGRIGITDHLDAGDAIVGPFLQPRAGAAIVVIHFAERFSVGIIALFESVFPSGLVGYPCKQSPCAVSVVGRSAVKKPVFKKDFRIQPALFVELFPATVFAFVFIHLQRL